MEEDEELKLDRIINEIERKMKMAAKEAGETLRPWVKGMIAALRERKISLEQAQHIIRDLHHNGDSIEDEDDE